MIYGTHTHARSHICTHTHTQKKRTNTWTPWNRTLFVLAVATHDLVFTFPFLFRPLSFVSPFALCTPFLVLNVSSSQPAFVSLQSPLLFSSFVFLSYPWTRSVCSRWMSGRDSGVAKLFVGPGPCNRVFDVRQQLGAKTRDQSGEIGRTSLSWSERRDIDGVDEGW